MRLEKAIDPTAGESARQIARHPREPRIITDPTDPRYGVFPTDEPEDREREQPAPPTPPAA